MGMRYDEKGKIFTDVISKEGVPAVIQLPGYRIHGLIYVRAGERVKDELNQNEEFMAITDAVLYDDDGQVLYRTDFIAVNRGQIVWVIPDHNLVEEDAAGEGGA